MTGYQDVRSIRDYGKCPKRCVDFIVCPQVSVIASYLDQWQIYNRKIWWMNFHKNCSQLFLWCAFDAINKASNPADVYNIPIEDGIFINILPLYHLIDLSSFVFKFFSIVNGTISIFKTLYIISALALQLPNNCILS